MKDLGKFEIDDSLKFDKHPSGLVRGIVSTQRCRASFFLLGGHVAEYCPAGQEPVLFLSEAAHYEEGKAIRGGVPICFPWFGGNKNDPNSPSHGLVRTELWEVSASSCHDDTVEVTLNFATESLALEYRLSFGSSLELEMTVSNRSETEQRYELALHTYFSVGDIERVAIQGLEAQPFLDQLTETTESPAGGPIQFSEETDRIYWGEADQIRLVDESNQRTMLVEPSGSQATVVWNPWIAKSKRMPDFGDHEYPKMCCIETAKITPNDVALEPNGSSTTSVRISVES